MPTLNNKLKMQIKKFLFLYFKNNFFVDAIEATAHRMLALCHEQH